MTGAAGGQPIRVLVVEDHAIVRQGLVALIDAEPGLLLCGEAADWRGALAAIAALRPDVVLLDLQLGDGHGRELLAALARAPTRPRVLVLSMADEQVYARALVREGADGYLMKSAAVSQVAVALRHVAAGGTYLSDDLVRHSQEQAQRGRANAGMLEALSARELEVLDRLATGLTLRATARALTISEKTVDSHVRNIREKLGLSSSRQVREFAIAHRAGGGGTPPGAA